MADKLSSKPRDSKPGEKDEPRSYLSAIVNPALAAVGKIGARLELAPLAAHAIFAEASKVSVDVEDYHIEGTEYDFGYHLFPQGQGVRGFYLGPRYVMGSGESDEATGEIKGWGGDLGYQFVIANHIVLNLGAGAMYVEGTARLKDSLLKNISEQIPGASQYIAENPTEITESFWIPIVTAGLGVAF